MKPAPFCYHAPTSVGEALALLAKVAPLDGRVLAGGQSLMPVMALRLARPSHLVDINNVVGFDHLALVDGWLCIGPCIRHAELDESAAPGALGRLLAEVQRHIAHLPIRQRGTFCGSLANADPSSEWCLLAVTLGAEMVLSRQGSDRCLPAAAFVTGIMTTALEPEEMLTQVRIPLLPNGSLTGFFEYSRRAGDYAQAVAMAVFELQGGVCTNPRIGLGAIEDRPRRLAAVEAVLEGKPPSLELFQAAAAAARPVLNPMDDDPYRVDLAEAAIRRALGSCHGSAGLTEPGMHDVTLVVNGEPHAIRVEARRTLADAIRQDCGLTGTHLGCEHGVCGACTVLLDDQPVRACLMFAVQANNRRIRTVEGLADGNTLSPLQQAFVDHHALQCGYCTPGFLMLGTAILEQNPAIGDAALIEVLSSNLCRCTGYANIVKAVRAAAATTLSSCA